MKKYIHLFLFFAGIGLAFGDNAPHPRHPFLMKEFDYGDDGKIDDSFWTSDPLNAENPVNEGLPVMKGKNLWELIQKVPKDYILADYQNFSSSALDAANQLQAFGFDMNGICDGLQKLDNRFYAWLFWTGHNVQCYLIDTTGTPVIYNVWGMGQVGHATASFQKLSDDTYRLFLDATFNDGPFIGTPCSRIEDIDLKNKTRYTFGANGYLDPHDHCKVIYTQMLGFGITWDWIYEWNGKKWVNVSSKYPEHYKNKVYPELQKDLTDPWKSQQPFLAPLATAAKAGGPSAFIHP